MGKSFKPESVLLRQKAEELLNNKKVKRVHQFSEADALRLIQELEVHIIELELQKEELVLAKEQVKKVTEDKFVELYDFAPSGYITLSKEGKICEINLSGSQMLCKDRSSLIGSVFAFFVSDDTKSILNHFFKRVYKSSIKTTCQVTLSMKLDTPIFVQIDGIAIENGERCLLTMVDITELKIAEQNIRIGQEKYRTLLNASPDGIILIDLKGFITEVSEIGLELFCAARRTDMIGKDYHFFVPSRERKTIRKIAESTMNEGLVQNVELLLERKDHTVFSGEVSSTLIQDQNGMPSSYMIIVRDISQRKKEETRQFHSDRITSLGEMASGIAHEINQPLNTISLTLDNVLLEASNMENLTKDYLKVKLDKIFENITRIRNIIDHVRAFSKNDDDYILTAFDVNLSIKNAVSMISEQFNHLDIELDMQLEENLPSITGNTFKLEQVMLNLLSNAKDALIEKRNRQTKVFDMKIGIRSFHRGQSIIIEVSDNGTGVGKEDIDHIMLPFYTTKDTGKGTGLGLSISYQIIKEMNGTIELSGNSNSGTTFEITLNTQNTNLHDNN